MVSEYGPASVALTSFRPTHERSPTNPPIDGPNARLDPHSTHTTPTSPIAMKQCIIVAAAFFLLTSPP